MKRSRDGLYRRGCVFAFRYRRDGIWKEKYTGKQTREEAKTFKEQFEEDLKKHELPTDKGRQTVEQVCTRWVEDHAAYLSSSKGRSNEKSYLRQLVAVLGRKRLKEVSLDTLRAYQRERSAEVAACVANAELRILARVLKENNLWRGTLLHFKRLPELESEIGQALTVDQVRHLQRVAAEKDSWMVAFNASVLAANTGLRGGEIRKLVLGCVDLVEGRIHVRRASTKTTAGRRTIKLNRSTAEAVARLYKRAQELGATDPEHFLLPADLSRHTKAGDPLKGQRGFDPTRHQESWATAWKNLRRRAAERAGDPESAKTFRTLRFHDLRHTFVTLQAEIGTPLPVVQSIVGHMSDAITRHYTSIHDLAMQEAMEKLERRMALVGDLVGSEEIPPASPRNSLN